MRNSAGPEPEPPDRLLQSLEEPLVITLVLEDGPPEVATGHHVMDRAGIFYPQRSGHVLTISHGARPGNRTCPREAHRPGVAYGVPGTPPTRSWSAEDGKSVGESKKLPSRGRNEFLPPRGRSVIVLGLA